ncbi:hypothetical protein [Novosphingobium sp. M1R2S20]|uniref:Uncharacterized protein n=1 Tax=Novosphingobium rhizovicinum TaxID=3228928 RepID=A0ABV3R8L8_9SPHN
MPAPEIETLVTERVAQVFDDPLELMASACLEVPADLHASVTASARALAARLRSKEHSLVRDLIAGVEVQQSGIVIHCTPAGIAAALGVDTAATAPDRLTLGAQARLTRSGRALRLVHDSGTQASCRPERSLSRLLAQAHGYWRELRRGELDIKTLAAREGVSASWITRVLRLAFLAPDITTAILKGAQHGKLEAGALVSTGAVDPDWSAQRKLYLPAAK